MSKRYKDPSGLWKAVPGRPLGSPQWAAGRDRRGRFKRVRQPPPAHWRLDLPPARVTYHREPGRGGRTYFKVRGRRVSDAVAQHEIALALRARLEQQGIVGYTGDLEPAREDAEDSDRVEFEANDSDLAIDDVQAAYELAGGEKGFLNDPEDTVEPEVDFSGQSRVMAIDYYWRNWETVLRASPFGRWAMRDKKIGAAVAYYALAHKVVYEGKAAFGVLVRTPYAPLGREAAFVLRERMEKLEAKSEEPVEWTVAGFWLLVKVLT